MYIAIDTETTLIHRGCLFPQISCMTYAAENGALGIYCYTDGGIEEYVLARLAAGDHLIMHNAPFDIGVLCEEYPRLLRPLFAALDEGRIHDTKIRQKLIDIALGLLATDSSGEKNQGFYRNKFDGKVYPLSYSLAALHFRRTGEALEKGQERVTFGALRDVPLAQWPAAHQQYAIKDAEVTLPLFMDQQDPRCAKYLEDEAAQVRKAVGLSLITAHGLKTDPRWVAKLQEVTERECAGLEVHLRNIKWLVGATLKQAPAQQRALDCAVAQQRCPKLTNKGDEIVKANFESGYATGIYGIADAPVMIVNDMFPLGGDRVTTKHLAIDKEAAEDSGDVDLIKRSQYVSARGVLTKSVPLLAKGYTLPIQPSYESLMATGRTSSYGEKKKKKTDPEPALVGDNIQNQKRVPGIRECYVSRPGYVFCSVDYDTAELRTLAEVCYVLLGRSTLGDLINAGRDPHTWFAGRMLHLDYDQAAALRKAKDKAFDKVRTAAKAADFGYPGGSGAGGFARFAKGMYGIRMTETEAADLKRAFLEAYDEMPAYFKYVGAEVKAAGGKAQIKHLYSNRYRGGCRYTVACNTRFQGLAADGAAAALWELVKGCYLPGHNDLLFGVRIVAFIHDEFIFEIPDIPGRRWHVAQEAARVMIDAFNRFVPHCPVTATPVLMRRWSKNADVMRDEQGNVRVDECGTPLPWDCELSDVFKEAV